MGWMDKAKAAAKMASEAASNAAKQLADEAEAEFGTDAWYKDAKKAAGEFGESASAVWEGTKEASLEVAQEIGQTEFGKAVGEKTRAAGKFLGAHGLGL